MRTAIVGSDTIRPSGLVVRVALPVRRAESSPPCLCQSAADGEPLSTVS